MMTVFINPNKREQKNKKYKNKSKQTKTKIKSVWNDKNIECVVAVNSTVGSLGSTHISVSHSWKHFFLLCCSGHDDGGQ